MTLNHKKSATYRLAQAAKAHRARTGSHLNRVGLHPGQDLVLKSLAEEDGQTMSRLAHDLGVQPPTVTKMVTRLAANGFVVRQASEADGRLSRVFLTEAGRELIAEVDRVWKRVEKEALAGIDEKDRKRLRKILRQVEKNLLAANGSRSAEDDDAETLAEISEVA
jgi:DNA-binding MarR family transcriptional regulator